MKVTRKKMSSKGDTNRYKEKEFEYLINLETKRKKNRYTKQFIIRAPEKYIRRNFRRDTFIYNLHLIKMPVEARRVLKLQAESFMFPT
jgi:hypothetical protein